jgi:glycosyltransferase involved in cell wall biosynthesis
MLYVLPLEPLDERYTTQWRCWFARALRERGTLFKYIDGEKLTETVESGLVLDACGTNYWKMTQAAKVCQLFHQREVSDGDKFFTMDLWHPGLEVIPYMAQLQGVRVEVYGFLHAGSYTRLDFAEPMASWAQHFERGWFSFCKKIFVASEYHANNFWMRRCNSYFLDSVDPGQIVVTGNPIDTSEILARCQPWVPASKRENIVVFPHRWDKEKQPDVFVQIMQLLWRCRQDFRVLITTGRKKFADPRGLLIGVSFPYEIYENLSKYDYYLALAKAKVMVSCAVEEHFGYAFCESAVAGCAPVVPNAYSYPEILNGDTRFLYNNTLGAVSKVDAMLDAPESAARYVTKYNESVGRILSAMGV